MSPSPLFLRHCGAAAGAGLHNGSISYASERQRGGRGEGGEKGGVRGVASPFFKGIPEQDVIVHRSAQTDRKFSGKFICAK